MNPIAPRTALAHRSSLFARALRASSLVAAFVAALALSACDAGSSGPRALILVDASDAARPAQVAWIDARRGEFEKSRNRAVRVLHVSGADAALELASRGEADVALVPEGAPKASLDRFVADHGREVGVVTVGDDRLKVLVVNAKQHPKVDAQGQDLAAFLAGSSKTP